MKKRILICDDDPEILFICSLILEKQGYEVHTSLHCINIQEIVRKASPDVILMDNWIPDSGGIVASKTIRSHREMRHIPIVYFSANNDIEALSEQAGAVAFLAKPFDLSQLENVIAEVLKTNT
jgi:DNA-binding NtrC family response regulator